MRGEPVSKKRARAPQGVCAIIRAEAKPGAGAKLKWLLAELAQDVRASEEGCASYVVTHTIGAPRHFAVLAHFTSWEAFEAHAETQHLTRVLPELTALLAAPISMEIFLELAPLRRAVRVGDARREVEPERQRK
jgi:quinol monooxygenase YgiN